MRIRATTHAGKYGLRPTDNYGSDLRSIMHLTGAPLNATQSLALAGATQIIMHYLTAVDYFSQACWPDTMKLMNRRELIARYLAAMVARCNWNCYELGPYTAGAEFDPDTLLDDSRRQRHALTTVHGISVMHTPRPTRAGIDALGMYPVQSLINHSCIPNLAHSFIGRVSYFRAAVDIGVGGSYLRMSVHRCADDELTTEYGQTFGNGDTATRQQYLLDKYGFECTCAACTGDTYARVQQQLVDGYTCAKCCALALLDADGTVHVHESSIMHLSEQIRPCAPSAVQSAK
jgi:hypothetical protein